MDVGGGLSLGGEARLIRVILRGQKVSKAL